MIFEFERDSARRTCPVQLRVVTRARTPVQNRVRPLSEAYPWDISKKSVEIHFLHKIAPLQQGKTCFSRSSAPLQLQTSERPVRLYSQVSPLNIKIKIILNKNIVLK